MSKIKVDTIAVLDDSSSVPTATLTALPARVTAAENGKAVKGANNDITSLSALTTAITLAQGGHGATTADGARSALGIPGRNRIINGACVVAQRASVAFGTGVGGYAGPDRYLAANSGTAGGQFTQSQGTIVDGGVTKLAIVQTVNTAIVSTTGVNYWGGIIQFIEGFNCFDLVGSPVALSFLFKTNVTGNFSVAVRDSTGAVSYNTTFAAVTGVPVKVTINIPAVPSNAAIPQVNTTGMQIWVGPINTGTYQAPAGGAWSTANYMTVPSATNWGATIGNYISLTDLQFEAGTATPFERRSYQLELAMCQRYFQTLYANGRFTSTGNQYILSSTVALPVSMRANPTTSYVTNSGSANAYSWLLTPNGTAHARFDLINSVAGDSYILSALYTLNAEL